MVGRTGWSETVETRGRSARPVGNAHVRRRSDEPVLLSGDRDDDQSEVDDHGDAGGELAQLSRGVSVVATVAAEAAVATVAAVDRSVTAGDAVGSSRRAAGGDQRTTRSDKARNSTPGLPRSEPPSRLPRSVLPSPE